MKTSWACNPHTMEPKSPHWHAFWWRYGSELLGFIRKLQILNHVINLKLAPILIKPSSFILLAQLSFFFRKNVFFTQFVEKTVLKKKLGQNQTNQRLCQPRRSNGKNGKNGFLLLFLLLHSTAAVYIVVWRKNLPKQNRHYWSFKRYILCEFLKT